MIAPATMTVIDSCRVFKATIHDVQMHCFTGITNIAIIVTDPVAGREMVTAACLNCYGKTYSLVSD